MSLRIWASRIRRWEDSVKRLLQSRACLIACERKGTLVHDLRESFPNVFIMTSKIWKFIFGRHAESAICISLFCPQTTFRGFGWLPVVVCRTLHFHLQQRPYFSRYRGVWGGIRWLHYSSVDFRLLFSHPNQSLASRSILPHKSRGLVHSMLWGNRLSAVKEENLGQSHARALVSPFWDQCRWKPVYPVRIYSTERESHESRDATDCGRGIWLPRQTAQNQGKVYVPHRRFPRKASRQSPMCWH